MTLIAYKDGIICADTLCLRDGLRDPRHVMKIARDNAGFLFGFSGRAAIGMAWMEWFLGGRDGAPPIRVKEDNPDQALIIEPNGWSIRYNDDHDIPEKCAPDRIGLGWASYMHGMMDAGLSSKQAIATGIEHYVNAGFPIVEIGHRGPPTIWETATRQMPIEAFERRIGKPLDHYFRPID